MAKKAWARYATEVCIQGGIHPELDIEYYVNICKNIKKVLPDIHIHAFSPMEIYHVAEKSGLGIEESLRFLKENGLDSMPGTAAEILDDKIRAKICPKKIDTETWCRIIKIAHKLNIPTTATIMYGHIDTIESRVGHIFKIKNIQDETHGFTEFIPLSFIHYNTILFKQGYARSGATGIDDIKMHAISRIILKNFRNIQASWVKLGLKLAQFCLNAGANDLGGTLMGEQISRCAGAYGPSEIDVKEIHRLIRDLGRHPAQRSTDYRILKVF
jgi:FO synthase subunit 2